MSKVNKKSNGLAFRKETRKPKTKLPFTQSKAWSNRYIYIMVFITVAYFIVFRYWPMLWISIAFKDFKLLRGFMDSQWNGLDNFRHLFRNMDYLLRLLRNTFALNILSLVFAFPAPIIFAIFLNEIRSSKLKRTVQTVSYLPHFLSTVVVVGIVTTFLSPSLGILNRVLYNLGFDTINFLTQANMFWGLMVVVGIWQSVGWSAIIYLAAILGIDPTLYEAAEIDGCGRFKKIWHITLPGIRSTIIILLILQIGNLMNVDTEKIFLFQNDLNLRVSEMFPTYTYKLGIVRSDYARATAVGLFSSMISLTLVLIANFFARKYSETSIF